MGLSFVIVYALPRIFDGVIVITLYLHKENVVYSKIILGSPFRSSHHDLYLDLD